MALSGFVLSCGGRVEPDRHETISGGTDEHGYPAVGIVGQAWETVRFVDINQYPAPRPSAAYGCTATLIAPHVVLTAAHCALQKYRLDVFEAQGRRYLVEKVVPHPSYRYHTLEKDIALVWLRDPVPISPMRVSTRAPTPSMPITLVGYGNSLGGLNHCHKPTATRGIKRSGQQKALEIYNEYFVYKGLPSICSGDSGGPSIARRNRLMEIVGVHSGSHPEPPIGFDVRVDSHAGWINDQLRPTNRHYRVDSNGAWVAVGQSLARWRPGDTLRVKGLAFAQQLNGQMFLAINYVDSIRHNVAARSRPISGTADWTWISLDFTIPAGTTYIDAFFVVFGHGVGYFDQLQVTNLRTGERIEQNGAFEIGPASTPRPYWRWTNNNAYRFAGTVSSDEVRSPSF